MIGDIALQISATEHSFITHLALCHSGEAVGRGLIEPFQTRLAQIASSSLSTWTTSTAQAAVDVYASCPGRQSLLLYSLFEARH